MQEIKNLPREYLFLAIVIVLIGIVAFYQLVNPKPIERGKKWGGQESSSSTQNNIPKTLNLSKEEAGVTVTVNYLPEKSVSSGVFSISLDTHNVNFDAFRFQTGVTLEKENEILQPLTVTENGSGHHRRAEVIFPRQDLPYTIVISNLAGISRRSFSFLP